MRYGTYTCGLARGGLEYGYTFGEPANEVDYATSGGASGSRICQSKCSGSCCRTSEE